MTPENFCYWLQGWYEINKSGKLGVPTPTNQQSWEIYNHLQLVFHKVTPIDFNNNNMNYDINVNSQSNKFSPILDNLHFVNVPSC